MKKDKAILFYFGLILIVPSTFLYAFEFSSQDQVYELVDNENNRGDTTNKALYPGDKVFNRSLNKEGKVGNVILINLKNIDILPFDLPAMKKIRVAKGYWLLKFPENTDLLMMLETIKKQEGIISADIEVIMNLNVPR